MKTLTPEQRIEGFTELEGVIGEGGVGGAHLMSFLAGVAHAEKVFASQEQDEGPVAWMFFSSKGRPHYHLNEYQALEGLKMYGGSKVIALYEHPAPRKPFVRLSEEECISIHRKWVDSGRSISRFARAIEDALEEKNK